jgi:hypothetical protein
MRTWGLTSERVKSSRTHATAERSKHANPDATARTTFVLSRQLRREIFRSGAENPTKAARLNDR